MDMSTQDGAVATVSVDASVAREPVDAAEPDAEQSTPETVFCSTEPCPLADSPVRACCTSDADVGKRVARKSGRCGLDLSALDMNTYGTSCWQRDQLGIIDERCPKQGAEPGCCADDGQCGSSDGAHALGCRHALGSATASCGDAAPVSTCDPTGNYGIRVTVDSTWDGRGTGFMSLTDDGRGVIQIYLLTNIESVDSRSHEVTASSRVCGVALPPFYSSTLCEMYQPIFPDALWESPKLPRPDLQGHYECGTQGCVLSLGPLTYLFGIRLSNPESTWPTAQQTPYMRCPMEPDGQCFPDDDSDGNPGVTVKTVTTPAPAAQSGGGTGRCNNKYTPRTTPLSANPAAIVDGVRRADRIQVGIRARVGGSIRFDDGCQTAMGSALAQYVNSRAKGCFVEEGTYDWLETRPAGANDACTASESTFIDESMPVYRVLAPGEMPRNDAMPKTASKGPVVSVVRFPAGGAAISCEQVRAAKY
jgi:hypothetical protein